MTLSILETRVEPRQNGDTESCLREGKSGPIRDPEVHGGGWTKLMVFTVVVFVFVENPNTV